MKGGSSTLNKQMKNPHKALEAIEHITGSDWGMDMESVIHEKNPRKLISRLREAGRIVSKIYQIAHAEGHCHHEDWEKIKYEILSK